MPVPLEPGQWCVKARQSKTVAARRRPAFSRASGCGETTTRGPLE
jgi:hypothetical protein